MKYPFKGLHVIRYQSNRKKSMEVFYLPYGGQLNKKTRQMLKFEQYLLPELIEMHLDEGEKENISVVVSYSSSIGSSSTSSCLNNI